MLPWREQLDNKGGPLPIARWLPAAIAVALLVAAAPIAARRTVATGRTLHAQAAPSVPRDYAADAREPHLRNLRMLTDGGENAEAYYSFDGRSIIFQSTRAGVECDQIFTMKADGTGVTRVSNGEGRTTCAYFYPDGKSVLYASTFRASAACPPKPGFEHGYVWPVYAGYDIFRSSPDGTAITPLTTTPGYDAEATIARDGRIVFTSVRDGDMEIYSMNGDGSDVRRLTRRPGPDGGPFFSADGQHIVFRGRSLQEGKDLDDYRALLRKELWRPASLEIYVMKRDGSDMRQLTNLGAASFAPYFTPDGRKIIFSTNVGDPRQRNFDLYLVNVDGTGLERVTYSDTFDGFPMFSPDGRKLVFASNRGSRAEGDTNVFTADWQ
jgi:Tol biopolymer transport system component